MLIGNVNHQRCLLNQQKPSLNAIGNVLRTLVDNNHPQNTAWAANIINIALETALHAMCTTVATTLGCAPGSLTFARDMFLNKQLIANWQVIARLQEHHVNEN